MFSSKVNVFGQFSGTQNHVPNPNVSGVRVPFRGFYSDPRRITVTRVLPAEQTTRCRETATEQTTSQIIIMGIS